MKTYVYVPAGNGTMGVQIKVEDFTHQSPRGRSHIESRGTYRGSRSSSRLDGAIGCCSGRLDSSAVVLAEHEIVDDVRPVVVL